MNNVLIIAVHPDDETLGCGGTILKHKKNGDKVYWLIVTGMKKEDGFSEKEILRREREIEIVAKTYKFDEIFKLELSTTKLDTVPMNVIIESISEVFNKIRPDIIYFPFIGDVHSDHRIIVEAVNSCMKTFRYPFIKKILMMEVLSETEFAPSLKEFAFTPNYFVDISDFIEKKIEIMRFYKSEIKSSPFPRSINNIKALATLRGAMAGCEYAESFILIKEIC